MHQLVVYAVKLCVVVELDLDLARFVLGLRTHRDARSKMTFEFFQRGASVCVEFAGRRFGNGATTRFADDEALELANGESAARDAMRKFLALFSVGNSDECARVACAESTFFHLIENWFFQTQNAHGVRNGGAIFAGARRNFFLRQMEFV